MWICDVTSDVDMWRQQVTWRQHSAWKNSLLQATSVHTRYRTPVTDWTDTHLVQVVQICTPYVRIDFVLAHVSWSCSSCFLPFFDSFLRDKDYKQLPAIDMLFTRVAYLNILSEFACPGCHDLSTVSTCRFGGSFLRLPKTFCSRSQAVLGICLLWSPK